MRPEHLIVGCILAVVGFVIAIIGFNNMQESSIEKLVDFAVLASGKPAPPELQHSHAAATITLILGGGLFVAGLGVILNSRKSS